MTRGLVALLAILVGFACEPERQLIAPEPHSSDAERFLALLHDENLDCRGLAPGSLASVLRVIDALPNRCIREGGCDHADGADVSFDCSLRRGTRSCVLSVATLVDGRIGSASVESEVNERFEIASRDVLCF